MADPTPIPFAAWEPDKSDRMNPAAEAKGCISQAGQYAPFPDIQDYGAASQLDSFTKVLLHFDGTDGSTTIRDDAPTPHAWTASGNAQIDTAQSKFGGASLLLDGTGDFVSTPDSADFTLGAGDWTVDLWFNCNAAGGTFENLAGQSTGSESNSAWQVFRTTVNTIRAMVFDGSSFTFVDGTTQFTNVINPGWHHLALVRSGNILRLFVDGVLEGGEVAFTGTVPDATVALDVGTIAGDTSTPWTGWIDEFRLSVGIARWTANFTPSTVAYTRGGTTDNVVLGSDTFYDEDTVPHIFAGDASKLYHLESRVAVDRSKAGGYALGAEDTWQLAQFGNNVVAVTAEEPPQHFDLAASPIVAFADLAGSPPDGATSVARVNDFLMMGKGFTVHWSAFNDVTDWTPDPATQAGNQELDQERGEIISIVGLDYAAIFQERGVRRAIYVGPPVIWDFGQDYVEKARGCIARNAATPFGRIIFYAADDGFYAFDGQASTPIGVGKVDTYFTRNLNYAYRHKISVGIDYSRKLIVWACPMGGNQLPSELLIYSVQDGRWTHDMIDLEFLFDSPAEPQTIDQVGGFWDQSIDAPPVDTFDIDSGVLDDRRIRLAAWAAGDHRLGLFNGQPRTATIETAESELIPGRRGLVTEVWPMGDMQQGAVSASIGYRRALPGASKVYTSASQMNRVGFCPQRIDARFGSVRLEIAAGANWRRMEGVHVTAVPTGGR
jgi:hypothetical protein